ncbi:MAG: cytidine deaminase [Aminivibrio sp.]|jgi:cytidine deaminase
MTKSPALAPFRAPWPEKYPSPEKLLQAAEEARSRAYAPYSRFSVGAAIYAEGSASFFTGCNIENGSYSLSMCAERNAAGAMIAGGFTKPLAIAVAGRQGEPCLPCGACRQFLAEFNPDLLIVLREGREAAVLSLKFLFPAPFILSAGGDL